MTCSRCGRPTPCKNGNQRYCPECKAIVVSIQNKQSKIRSDAKRKYMKTILPKDHAPTIEEINQRAREAGMSYGKYVAQMKEE